MSYNVFDPMRSEIEDRFKAGWLATGEAAPVKYEQVPFQQPKQSEWIEIIVRPINGEQVSIATPGNRLERQYGIVIFRAFGLPDKGTALLLKLIDKAANVFRGINFTSASRTFRFFNPRLSPETTMAPGRAERVTTLNQVNLVSRTITIPFEVDGFY